MVLVYAYSGWLGRRDWTVNDRKIGVFFSSAMVLRLLSGVILYIVLSPTTQTAFSEFGLDMCIADAGFFTLENILYMVVAVIFVYIVIPMVLKATPSVYKHRRAALLFNLVRLAFVVAMPWFRPLLPGLD